MKLQFSDDTSTMSNRNSFVQWLRDRSANPAEALCDDFAAELQRIARTKADLNSERRKPR